MIQFYTLGRATEALGEIYENRTLSEEFKRCSEGRIKGAFCFSLTESRNIQRIEAKIDKAYSESPTPDGTGNILAGIGLLALGAVEGILFRRTNAGEMGIKVLRGGFKESKSDFIVEMAKDDSEVRSLMHFNSWASYRLAGLKLKQANTDNGFGFEVPEVREAAEQGKLTYVFYQ